MLAPYLRVVPAIAYFAHEADDSRNLAHGHFHSRLPLKGCQDVIPLFSGIVGIPESVKITGSDSNCTSLLFTCGIGDIRSGKSWNDHHSSLDNRKAFFISRLCVRSKAYAHRE